MTYSTELAETSLPLPITQSARRTAQQFASLQPTTEKAEQVRLNTLAVYAVNGYLEMMGIPTNLATSDTRNPAVQLAADVSDLEVTGLGRLECRPIRQQEQTCHMPSEAWHDRIGYVVIQIDEAAQEAIMLGFSATANVEQLPLSRLQPPEALLDHLYELSQPIVVAASPKANRTLVNLSQWLQNAFEAGWQTVDSLLNPPEMGFAFRTRSSAETPSPEQLGNTINRAKLIDLGIQLADRPIALTVELSPQPDGQTGIYLRVQPTNRPFLPPDLQLAVLDETGATFLQAQSRSADNYLQLELSGNPGERFSVQVSLREANVVESFII